MALLPRGERVALSGHQSRLMRQDDILEECLAVHRRLLTVEQDLHAWLTQALGFEVATPRRPARKVPLRAA